MVLHHAIISKRREQPLLACFVQAGFPSPADDYVERALDLNDLLVENEAATYYVRAKGDSMEGAGIRDGDLLVVDRSLEPHTGAIVIAALDGEFVVKSLCLGNNGYGELRAANPRYKPIMLGPERDCQLWGVVKAVIHRF